MASDAHSAWSILLYIIGSFVCMFSLCSSIFLVYVLKKHHSKDMHTSSYPTTFAAAFFYFSSSIIYLRAMTLLDIRIDTNLEDKNELVLLTMFFILCIIMARLAICTQFIVRLYITFKMAPEFAVSRRTLIITITLSTLVFIIAIWWSVLMVLRFITLDQVNTTSFNGQFIAVTVSMLVFDSSAAWFVVGTMTDKLLQTIDLRDRSEYTHRMEHMQRISERGISNPPEQGMQSLD